MRLTARPTRTALPDTGPSPIRYLAVLGGSALAVLATGVLVPAAGHSVRSAFCGDGDTACAPRTVAAAADATCRVLSHADVLPDDAVVFTDDLGGSGRLVLSRTVDKNAVVHWFVRRDDVPGSEHGGELTEFPTEDAARAYLTAAQHDPVRTGLEKADPTGLLARIAGTVDGTPLPEQLVETPDAYFVDAGSALDLGAQARSGISGTIVGGGVTGVSEIKVTNNSQPVTTIFVQLTDSAGKAFRLADSGMTVVSVASDAQGRPQQLVVETAGRLRGWLGPAAVSGPDLMTMLLDAPRLAEPGSFTGRVSIRIDLGLIGNLDTAADALHEIGVPLLLDAGTSADDPAGGSDGSGGSGSSVDDAAADAGESPVADLYDLIDSGASGTSVTVSAYRTDDDSVSPAVTLGVQGGLTVKGARPGDDFYYAPAQGLVRWQTCDS